MFKPHLLLIVTTWSGDETRQRYAFVYPPPLSYTTDAIFYCTFCENSSALMAHPYIQLVSVLCIPVSSIPTSLSFLKSFCPCLISNPPLSPFMDEEVPRNFTERISVLESTHMATVTN